MGGTSIIFGIVSVVLLIILLGSVISTTSDFTPFFTSADSLPDFLGGSQWGFLILGLIMFITVIGGLVFIIGSKWSN